MTYFNENIFQNILSYCDDRIERKQKKLMNKVIKNLGLFQKDLLSVTFKNIIEIIIMVLLIMMNMLWNKNYKLLL